MTKPTDPGHRRSIPLEDWPGLLSQAFDIAIYRMLTCPFAAEVTDEFEDDSSEFGKAKKRYAIFALWCVRRAVMEQCINEYEADVIFTMLDSIISHQFDELYSNDEDAIMAAVDAMNYFDAAIHNTEKPWAGASTSTAAIYWLNKAATSFVFGGNHQMIVPDPDNMEKWARRLSLPGRVLLEILSGTEELLVKHGAIVPKTRPDN